MDITTCSGGFVFVPCGFSGYPIFPYWRITWIDGALGSVMSETFYGFDILSSHGRFLNLRWIPDQNTVGNDFPNGILIFGPVSEFFDQLTYQCVFKVANNSDIDSTIGTLTVVGEWAVYVRKYYSVPN